MREHTVELVDCLRWRLQSGNRLVVAIDGTSAALKSTLAAYLAEELGGAVVHCDDFFLPMELRSESRYQEPGGNIHYERMKKEVISKLKKNTFNYMRYDCSKQALRDNCFIDDVPLRIVEGAYAFHPYFGKYFDFSIVLTVDEQEQMKRIAARNPNPQMFREKWIPLEQKYFTAFDITDRADCILDTTDWK